MRNDVEANAPVAVLAREGLLARVGPGVLLERPLGPKPVTTDGAAERPVVGVDVCVLVELRR